MTRPLIHRCPTPLTTDTLNTLCYLHDLLKSSPGLCLPSHTKLNSIIKTLFEPPHLLSLGGNEESYITRQLHKPHLILITRHIILLQVLKLSTQLISLSE